MPKTNLQSLCFILFLLYSPYASFFFNCVWWPFPGEHSEWGFYNQHTWYGGICLTCIDESMGYVCFVFVVVGFFSLFLWLCSCCSGRELCVFGYVCREVTVLTLKSICAACFKSKVTNKVWLVFVSLVFLLVKLVWVNIKPLKATGAALGLQKSINSVY